MEQVHERLKAESETLYKAVIKAAKKKWDVTDYQKLSAELYVVTLANKKSLDKTIRFKCYFIQGSWNIWAYEDEEKLNASLKMLNK